MGDNDLWMVVPNPKVDGRRGVLSVMSSCRLDRMKEVARRVQRSPRPVPDSRSRKHWLRTSLDLQILRDCLGSAQLPC